LLNRIIQTIERHRMFEVGQSVGVAVSGGADSVCLLHALLELAPKWDLHLTVLHLNHQLRGEESRQDAGFVRELAARLGLPVCIREAGPFSSQDNLEQAARLARLAFFEEMLAAGKVARVALGHTRSDQAETVLFRFLRGSGTAGLAGIRPVTSQGLVRPLIEIERSQVQQFLSQRGIPWREDSSNASLQFARNRIRHQLLPQLAAGWNPAIVQTLAHTADWALAEEAYWETEIDRLAAAHFAVRPGAVCVRVDALVALPLAAARRLVRRAMERVKSNLRGVDFKHIAAVLELAASGAGSGRVQAPGLDICRSFEWLRFSRGDRNRQGNHRPDGGYRLAAAIPGIVPVPGANLAFSLELIEKKETSEESNNVYNDEMGCLDWRRLSGSLELRNWRPGDRYQPSGGTAKEKIRTLFQQARIPLWERPNWPVLTDGTSIVWVRLFGPAAEFAASPGSSLILKVREVPNPGSESVGV
jgi:tRNA(Ile)-lysidine synthase